MIVVSGVMTFSPSIHDRVLERARTLTAETLKEPGCPRMRGAFLMGTAGLEPPTSRV
jgi:hypothetical protein